MIAYGTSVLQQLRARLREFQAANGANVTVTFALALVPIVGFTGAAVDYSRANSIKAAMQAAADTTALMLSRDPRWSAWRLIVQTFLVATALLLVGAIRAFADFDAGDPLTWLYLGGLAGAAGALLLIRRSAERISVGPIEPGGSRWPSPVS